MKNIFANLYELIIRHPQFSEIVYKSEDYVWLGFYMILIPFILSLVFYKFWDPSPTKIYKWVITVLLISFIIVICLSYYQLWTGSLEIEFINGNPDVANYAISLAMYNAIYCLITAIIWTVIIKRFSVNNSNNPI